MSNTIKNGDMPAVKTLYMADLQGMSEAEVKNHIASEYAGNESGFDCGNPSDKDTAELLSELDKFIILIAYEHVGSWGCDSSSYFLMREKTTGDLYQFTGGHCSCFGFEGQYDPEKTSIEYLTSGKFCFYGGGYDDESETHKQMMVEFFKALEATK